MNRLPPLPRDATPPAITQMGGGFGGGSSNQSLSWFFVQLLPKATTASIESYQRLIEETVKAQHLETMPGRGGGRGDGRGSRTSCRSLFDPYRAAELGDLRSRASRRIAGSANDVSGGFVDVGRRQYTAPLRRTLLSPSSWPSWCSTGATAGR